VSDPSPVIYFDRYVRAEREEAIYGEKWLRWTCEHPVGRLCLRSAISRPWFSRLYGTWADSPASRREIVPFLEKFGLDPAEFSDPVESFRTFNEFFHRRLAANARPIDPAPGAAIFPADGRHSLVHPLDQTTTIYAKGQRLDLTALLGDGALAQRFAGGTAIFSRLCPVDYHRFHFPLAGTPDAPRVVNGALFSVNPIALRESIARLWQNRRAVTEVSGSPVGDYLFVEVGATNVGGIVPTAEPGTPVEKGDEKGYFRLGGSLVITLFSAGVFTPADDLVEQSSRGVELYARMGDRMGTVGTPGSTAGNRGSDSGPA